MNSFNEYVFHIYSVPEILLGIIKSEIIAIVSAFEGQEVDGRRKARVELTDGMQSAKCPDDNGSSVKSLIMSLNWAK